MIIEKRATVDVVSTKWNGGFHRSTPSVELGSDESGTWLWIPPGTMAITPTGPFAAIPGLRLLPVDQWWSAYIIPARSVPSGPAGVYVDISTPARRHRDRFEFVDLDLDVEQTGGHPAVVLDRDEFDDHRSRWSYPPEIVVAAEAACRSVVRAIDEQRPPFDDSYWQWWDQRLPDIEKH